jgi:acyl carrier protein
MDDRLAVRGFLEKLLGNKGDRRAFADNESLAAAGRLDSVDVLDVVVFLERNYGLDFGDRFDQEDLDSVDRILALLPQAGGHTGGSRVS